MVELNVVVILLSLAGMVLTIVAPLAGLMLWFDRKQSARIDRLEDRLDKKIDNQGAELRQEIQGVNQRIDNQAVELQVIRSKVDRMQGTLDLMVYGREAPPPVAQSRAEDEERLTAPAGD